MGKYALNGADRVVSGHLAKQQRAELGPAIQGSHTLIAGVQGHELLELGTRNQLDDLGKYGSLRHGSENLLRRVCLVAILLPQAVFRPFLVLRYAPGRTAVGFFLYLETQTGDSFGRGTRGRGFESCHPDHRSLWQYPTSPEQGAKNLPQKIMALVKRDDTFEWVDRGLQRQKVHVTI
jgi:hypothetical protein